MNASAEPATTSTTTDGRAVRTARLQAARARAWSNLAALAIIAGLAGVLARVVQLKVAPDPRLAAAAGSITSKSSELARRGTLYDRCGRLVATTTVGQRLFIDPQAVRDPLTIAVDVADLIGGDPIEIDQALSRRRNSRYVVAAELLEPWQVESVRQASLPGVGLEPRPVRHYPMGDVGRAIIGLVGRDATGLAGFEHVFQQRLRPVNGRLAYLRDAQRRPMWVSPEHYQRATPGDDVHLSIDMAIQEIAERHLAAAVRRQNAGGGRLVVLDCRSGELLALCDVLNPREGWEEQTEDTGRLVDPALGRNRCITDPYEPGSTFKPFVWAAATRLGRAQLDEVLPTPAGPPWRTSRGRSIRDDHYYENATWHTVLTKSINSGMAIVAERMSERELQQAIDGFGFGRRACGQLPGEDEGILTPPDKWSHYTQTSVAMGHEIAVTTLQMVRAFSVFARNGTIPRLRITATVAGESEYHLVQRVLPEPVALTVRHALADVMTEGTGRRARSDRYTIFGKSGTAQLPKREGGGYHEHRYVSSFIGGAPLDEPRVVVLCVIDDPDRKLGHYGGAIAGPVVRDVIDEVLGYLGVPAEEVATASGRDARAPEEAIEASGI